MATIYLDGEIIGDTGDPAGLKERIVNQRRQGEIPDSVNVNYYQDKDEVRINADSGRLRRPLIVVDEGEPLASEEDLEEKSLQELEEEGKVEYLDAEEEEGAYVAIDRDQLTNKHTHLEIDPATIHGLSASLVAYLQHNRGDRVNYGAKMSGQGLGLYAKNFLIRYDTNANILLYPQKPLVRTQTSDTIIGEHPIGQNLVVAVASFEGYNIEDAIIVNKSSIERGMGRTFHFRTYTSESRRYWGGQRDEIGIPDKDVRGYRSEEEYAHLDEDGIVNPETEVDTGEVLIGKTSPPKFLGSSEEIKMGLASRRETSKTVRHGEKGVVDSVVLSESDEGNKIIKVKLREERPPELGDKFATRHGQKGVIGLIVPEEDMPFTKDGVTPDVILSTHAIPSRMTVSQLIEIIGGKAAALRGERADGTAFKGETEEELREELVEHGFRYDGKEKMYHGITGEELESHIFLGPCYYLKLKHMVSDKLHARARGPVTLLTKQPTAGRARQGGLRLGEMEKDCFVSHGASMLLKERFGSDDTEAWICNDCGEVGIYDRREDKVYCPICGNSDLVKVEVPQAFLLTLNELKSLMISPKLFAEES